MKFHLPRPKFAHGFSLMELMVAMAIAMVLLATLSSVFSQSISAREKIDIEGQKIETARYSLETLAEDIRLAGFYGTLAPSFEGTGIVNGATPTDWKYVDPCNVPALGALPIWDSSTDPIRVPFAIFGYEAHPSGTLPAALIACLNNYKSGTDVLVIRRASTSTVTAGGAGYTAGDPYLQVSTCPDGAVDALPAQPPPFHARATTTSSEFNLHSLGCTATVPGSNAPLRKLLTHIYYISTCDDCTNNLDNDTTTVGDGVPTLKMYELGIPSSGGTAMALNLRTIAPQVENMHIEYGIDGAGSCWDDGIPVSAGATYHSGSHYYTAAAGGTTGTSRPTHSSGTSSDGGVNWTWAGTRNGSIKSWVVSNQDPYNGSSGTAVTGMAKDCSNEDMWEDVVAVKLFLVTRDNKKTTGYTDTKSFVVGSRTISAAGDNYHRKLMSSTIKLVNMAGRREAP